MPKKSEPTIAPVVPETPKRPRVNERVEHGLEVSLFASRWLLAPMYLGLVAALAVLVIKFGQNLIELIAAAGHYDFHELSLAILGLLDVTLLANLILIVIFAGYENFVSKMSIASDSEDRPYWMGHVDFSGLKIKLIGSLVAISSIELLKDFMMASAVEDYTVTGWRIGLHVTFVVSGVLFAVMDFIADKHVQRP